MDLGKPLEIIVVAYPDGDRRSAGPAEPAEQPIPLPADWPRRQPAPVPVAAPARPAHE